ncbi:Inner membrane protein YhaI [compost metagenome]
MEIKDWFLKVVRDNYANFNGRARRKEYWMFFLANVLIGVVFGILGRVTSLFTYVSGLISLALLIPSIAVAVRRLHDTNKSGWFLLLALIPFVNLYVIYLLVIEGDRGPNEYGPDPKAEENGANHPFNQAQDPFGSSQPNNSFGSSQPAQNTGNNDPFGNSQTPPSPSTPPADKDPFA